MYFVKLLTSQWGIVFMILSTKSVCLFFVFSLASFIGCGFDGFHWPANPVRATKCHKIAWVWALSHVKQDQRDSLPKSRVANSLAAHFVTLNCYWRQTWTSGLLFARTNKEQLLNQSIHEWNQLWFLSVVEVLKSTTVSQSQVEQRTVLTLVYSTFSEEQL